MKSRIAVCIRFLNVFLAAALCAGAAGLACRVLRTEGGVTARAAGSGSCAAADVADFAACRQVSIMGPVRGSGSGRGTAADAGDGLRLCGLALCGGGRSWAIVEDRASGTQIMARAGDRVFGFALEEIRAGEAVLASGARRVVLTLRRAGAAGGGREENPGLSRQSAVPAGTASTGKNTLEVAREKIDLAFRDLARIRKSAHIIPFYSGGTAAGFMVFGIKAGSPLLMLGLRNGDIVTHVNGRLLHAGMGPADLMALLGSAGSVNVLVNRDSATVNLCYRIR